ncbi:hypothetical protein [Flavobacterium sp.]|uniref:hypothetical protein n=1 Tax=Flavobacterium sp. TaxID=239 RepID=UPI00391AF193
MKKLVLLVISFLVLLSCKNEDSSKKSYPKKVQKTTEKETTQKKLEKKPKRIGEYMSDVEDYPWIGKHADPNSYYPRLVFQKEFLIYQFHGQCYYWFFTNHYYTGADKIELLWTYKTDCLYELKSIKNSNGVKKYPKNGDAFCEYSLVNDSVIKVKYNFPEWIKKVNEIEKDSIFPHYFYRESKGSI